MTKMKRGIPLRGPWFDSRSGHVGFMTDKVAPKRVFSGSLLKCKDIHFALDLSIAASVIALLLDPEYADTTPGRIRGTLLRDYMG
jgi:hypothetical protein